MSKGLMAKLRKNSSFKDGRVNVLSESKYLHEKDSTPTNIPARNVAFSGSINGGYSSGLTMIAGPSKHFKTAFGLIMMKAFMDKNPEGLVLFYDSEFGTPQGYFDIFKIDTTRIIHVPVTNLEELKFDMVSQLNELDTEDKVFVMVDSVGNLASKKEVEDAEKGSSAADMTRAKQFKSLFRMITPHLTMKDIPMVAINHTYDSQGLYPTKVVSGGTGMYYSADTIWIVGRQQDKVGTEIQGYHFVINVEKSRFVKEKSKIPISVSWDKGVDKFSALIDMAVDYGVLSRSGGWLQRVDMETGEVMDKKFREKETHTDEFWDPILGDPKFDEHIRSKYRVG